MGGIIASPFKKMLKNRQKCGWYNFFCSFPVDQGFGRGLTIISRVGNKKVKPLVLRGEEEHSSIRLPKTSGFRCLLIFH
jgi:hypothetical protein